MIKPCANFEGMEITFNTTEDCNLRCKYCYEINKKPVILELEKAKKFIDIILDDPDPLLIKGTKDQFIEEEGIVLDFIGGDALMNVEVVDKILDYWQLATWSRNHRYARRWRASISTNGTLFEKNSVRDFMEKYKYNLCVGVSIDGCPTLHDMNRVYVDGTGTMKDIMKWWPWYTNWCRESGNILSTKATLSRCSIPYIAESVKFLYEELGISQINMNFVMEDTGVTIDDLKELESQLEKTKNYVLEHRNELYLGLLNYDMGAGTPVEKKEKPDACRCGGGCMPALAISGKIYPCFRFLPHTTFQERDFSFGSVDEGFNHKEIIAEIRSATNMKISDEKCKACPIESMCPYCIGGCYAEYGFAKRTTHICEIAKLQDKYTKIYWREYDKLEGTRHENAYLDTWEEWNARVQVREVR